MSWLERIYCQIWYHVEALWIGSKQARRPFTYMMRDFVIAHKILGVAIIILEIIGLAFLVRWNWIAGFFGLAGYFIVAGHLWWGTPVKPGEQEDPPVIDI